MSDPDDYTDPIIEEVRRAKEEISLRFPDIHSLFEYLREQQRLNPWPAGTVSFEQPRKQASAVPHEDDRPSDR